MTLITDPDNPSGDNNPDAVVIGGERLEPDDISVEDDNDDIDSDSDLDDEDGTPDVDPDDDDNNQDTGNFRQRHSDAVRWAQREKQRADTLEARINYLKSQGVDLEEIEGLLPKSQSNPNPAIQQDMQNYASKSDLANVAQNIQWSLARTAFLGSNPDFRDKNLGEMLEFQTAKLIRENVQKNGMLTVTPDKVYRNAAKAVKAMVKSLENNGKKKANQTRQKVKSQGSDLGGDTAKRSKGKPDEDKPFDPRAAYMGLNKF